MYKLTFEEAKDRIHNGEKPYCKHWGKKRIFVFETERVCNGRSIKTVPTVTMTEETANELLRTNWAKWGSYSTHDKDRLIPHTPEEQSKRLEEEKRDREQRQIRLENELQNELNQYFEQLQIANFSKDELRKVLRSAQHSLCNW